MGLIPRVIAPVFIEFTGIKWEKIIPFEGALALYPNVSVVDVEVDEDTTPEEDEEEKQDEEDGDEDDDGDEDNDEE